jgi:hypothetical protein
MRLMTTRLYIILGLIKAHYLLIWPFTLLMLHSYGTFDKSSQNLLHTLRMKVWYFSFLKIFNFAIAKLWDFVVNKYAIFHMSDNNSSLIWPSCINIFAEPSVWQKYGVFLFWRFLLMRFHTKYCIIVLHFVQ